MATLLQIVLDGEVPGLSDHRLSLGEFGPALNQLLAAARRIASNIYQDAHGPEHGAKGGRLARGAEQVDIQILGVSGESPTCLVAEISAIAPPGSTLPLYGDLTELTGCRLLEAIEAESQGRPASAVVRKYLQALPGGLTGQKYTLITASGPKKTVQIGEMKLADLVGDLPELSEWSGEISGVGFDPGKPQVRVRTDGRDVTFQASADQVEKALRLRGRAVLIVAVGIPKKRARVVTIGPDDAPPIQYDRDKHLWEKWDRLLRRLAK